MEADTENAHISLCFGFLISSRTFFEYYVHDLILKVEQTSVRSGRVYEHYYINCKINN